MAVSVNIYSYQIRKAFIKVKKCQTANILITKAYVIVQTSNREANGQTDVMYPSLGQHTLQLAVDHGNVKCVSDVSKAIVLEKKLTSF